MKNVGTSKTVSKRDKIRNLSKEELELRISESESISDMLRYYNISVHTGYLKLMRDQISYHNLEIPRYKTPVIMTKINNDDLFINGSICSRQTLIRHILDDLLIPHECGICKLGPEYNGKKLVLQLDHINGVNNDNQIENLRFLCPNCHSQTDTFTGRQHRKIRKCECGKDMWGQYDKCEKCYTESGKRTNISHKNNKCDCGKMIENDSTRCVNCHGDKSRIFHVSKEELEDMIHVQKLSYVEIGKKFDVSYTAIKKRAIVLGIELPKKNNYPIQRAPKSKENKTATARKAIISGKNILIA